MKMALFHLAMETKGTCNCISRISSGLCLCLVTSLWGECWVPLGSSFACYSAFSGPGLKIRVWTWVGTKEGHLSHQSGRGWWIRSGVSAPCSPHCSPIEQRTAEVLAELLGQWILGFVKDGRELMSFLSDLALGWFLSHSCCVPLLLIKWGFQVNLLPQQFQDARWRHSVWFLVLNLVEVEREET